MNPALIALTAGIIGVVVGCLLARIYYERARQVYALLDPSTVSPKTARERALERLKEKDNDVPALRAAFEIALEMTFELKDYRDLSLVLVKNPDLDDFRDIVDREWDYAWKRGWEKRNPDGPIHKDIELCGESRAENPALATALENLLGSGARHLSVRNLLLVADLAGNFLAIRDRAVLAAANLETSLDEILSIMRAHPGLSQTLLAEPEIYAKLNPARETAPATT